MNILVTGATGLMGAEVIREAMKDNAITGITALARKPLTMQHPKLNTILHQDFLDYSQLAPLFERHDACLWCLGVSQSQVNKEQYHVITHDFALAAGKAMLQSNPNITFMFLSGEGADPTEKSRTLFACVKGKTENALLRLQFNRLYIPRPGGIRPINKNPNAPLIYKLFLPLFPIFEVLTPSRVINSVQLAKAMLHIVKTKPDQVIFDNKELKQIASSL
ncbi:MAG TPA: NAD-dependent epimerase/dehydratase family protein [Chitinophagaceae bacterium]|nr:NAD-dependent epimerase/dehydratase family protein [Chitinophagaceae bacterium]